MQNIKGEFLQFLDRKIVLNDLKSRVTSPQVRKFNENAFFNAKYAKLQILKEGF